MKKTIQVLLILAGGVALGALTAGGMMKFKQRKCSCQTNQNSLKDLPKQFNVYSNMEKTEGINYYMESEKYFKVNFGPTLRAAPPKEITLEEYSAAYYAN